MEATGNLIICIHFYSLVLQNSPSNMFKALFARRGISSETIFPCFRKTSNYTWIRSLWHVLLPNSIFGSFSSRQTFRRMWADQKIRNCRSESEDGTAAQRVLTSTYCINNDLVSLFFFAPRFERVNDKESRWSAPVWDMSRILVPRDVMEANWVYLAYTVTCSGRWIKRLVNNPSQTDLKEIQRKRKAKHLSGFTWDSNLESIRKTLERCRFFKSRYLVPLSGITRWKSFRLQVWLIRPSSPRICAWMRMAKIDDVSDWKPLRVQIHFWTSFLSSPTVSALGELALGVDHKFWLKLSCKRFCRACYPIWSSNWRGQLFDKNNYNCSWFKTLKTVWYDVVSQAWDSFSSSTLHSKALFMLFYFIFRYCCREHGRWKQSSGTELPSSRTSSILNEKQLPKSAGARHSKIARSSTC